MAASLRTRVGRPKAAAKSKSSQPGPRLTGSRVTRSPVAGSGSTAVRPGRPTALAVQRRLALPVGHLGAVAVPLGPLQLAVGGDEVPAQRGAGGLGRLEAADGVQQVEGEAACVAGLVAL